MKKNLIKLLVFTLSMVAITIGLKFSHTPKLQRLGENIDRGIASVTITETMGNSPCVTNLTMWQDDTSGCVQSVVVAGSCYTQQGNVWFGTCLAGTYCGSAAPIITVTLKPGCCGPVGAAWVRIKCFDGTYHECELTVPSGKYKAEFQLIYNCPTCYIGYCVINSWMCPN